VYAAYGGDFVALSLAWGWIVDGQRPHRFAMKDVQVEIVGDRAVVRYRVQGTATPALRRIYAGTFIPPRPPRCRLLREARSIFSAARTGG
jgi:hypothetical protein